jgi:hypothetical protein
MTQQVVVVFAVAALFLLGIVLLAACSHGRSRPDPVADARIAADTWELRHAGCVSVERSPRLRMYQAVQATRGLRSTWRHGYVDRDRKSSKAGTRSAT